MPRATDPRRCERADVPTTAGGRRSIRAVLAAALVLFLLLAGERPLAAAGDDGPTVVVGTGNSLSGRVDVRHVGDADAPFVASMRRLSATAATRGLTVRVETSERLGDELPTAAILSSRWPPTDAADAAALVAWAQRGRGVLVLHGDPAAVAQRFPDLVVRRGEAAFTAIDPRTEITRAERESAFPVQTLSDARGIARVVVAATDADAAKLALPLLRHAIVRGGGVRHVPSAFVAVTASGDATGVTIEAPTCLPGEVVMDVLTVEGTQVLAPGPVRRIESADVPDGPGTIVRLRFRGEGVTDEVRIRLGDIEAGTLARATVVALEGPRAHLPAVFRVTAATSDGRPAAGCRIDASLGDAHADAATDATGTALVTFAADPSRRDRTLSLDVTVRGPRTERRIETDVRFLATAPGNVSRCVVQTDRPEYRPGGLVRLRVFALGEDDLPRPGADVALDVRDPRGRRVRAFVGRTDEFGVAAFEHPLAAPVTEGRHVAAVQVGTTEAETAFLVEERDRTPFDLRVDVPDRRAVAGQVLRGTVTASDWDGVPLADADVELTLTAVTPIQRRFSGSTAFEIAVPHGFAGQSPVLRVVVRHAGRALVSEVPLAAAQRAGATRLSAPDTVSPGQSLDVVVDAPQPGIVDIDLVGPGRLLASASVETVDGKARARLSVPDDALGAADLHVRRRGADSSDAASRPVTICRSPLIVDVDAPTDVRPGDEADARIRVRDSDGAPVPALLDVRGVDRAYAASAGTADCDPRTSRARMAAPVVLGWDDGRVEARVFALRCMRASADAIRRGQEAVAAGRTPDARTPWGTPVFVGRSGRSVVVVADGAATPSAICETAGAAAATTVAPAELLPVGTLRVASSAQPDTVLDEWFARHQSPDGSFHPVRFSDACRGLACGGAGPPEAHVAATALVTLVYLGAGETHQSGNYKETVRGALEWLVRQQRADGFIGDRAAPCAALGHVLAACALGEAWGMTQSARWEPAARQALAALAALQRPDGSFAEAGSREGSVILGTFAVTAWRSARMGALPVPAALGPRYLAWLDAHSDAATSAPSLSAEETALYPFGRTRGARIAAACALFSRILVAGERPDTPETRRAEAILLDDLPRWSVDDHPEDALGIWIGTMAMYQRGGAAWKRWSAAMESCLMGQQGVGDACSRGSWDAAPEEAGRLLTSAFACLSLEVFYRYGRVFGSKDGGGSDAEPLVRRDFPDLFASDLALPTDAAGASDLRIRIPDQITTWHLGVGAWDRQGRYGRGVRSIRSTLPLSVSANLPPRLFPGDVVRVPVGVRSTTDEGADVRLEVTVEGNLEILDGPAAAVHVDPGATAAAHVTVRATGAGRGTLRIAGAGGGHSDALELGTDVVRPRPPAAVSAPVAMGVPVSLGLAGATDARATLRCSPGVLGAARSSLAALIQRPTGCFEQTSATLYPAVLAARLLGVRRDDAHAAVLHEGWQRVLTFEAARGGFGLYPGHPPRSDLTALGVHLLLDMDPVVSVDPAVLDRAGRSLAAHLPDDPAQRILALGALRRLGVATDAAPPPFGRDPYLAALTLTQRLAVDDAAQAARALLVGTADRDSSGGAIWRSGAEGLFAGVTAGPVETTALAVEALARAGGEPELVLAGLRTLRRSMRFDGTWSTTRTTIAVLSALLAAAPTDATCRIDVSVGGRAPIQVPLAGDDVDVDLGAWSGKDSLVVRHEGTGQPWVTLWVAGTADARAVQPSPLTISVLWPVAPVVSGTAVEVSVDVRNVSGRRVTAPMVVMPVPAGLAVDRRRLEQLEGVAYAEVRSGEVRLYLADLADLADAGRVSVRVPFAAATPGTYATGAATTYPYYLPDEAASCEGAIVTVVPR